MSGNKQCVFKNCKKKLKGTSFTCKFLKMRIGQVTGNTELFLFCQMLLLRIFKKKYAIVLFF